MRASTMLALTLALLSGLGAVVAARYAGWLGKTVQTPAPVKKEEVQVLVAARNLFPGDVIDSTWVRTRPLRADETAAYEANKDQYLPAATAAATLRVSKGPIEAETPLLRKHLEDLVKPDALNQRLLPNMRALNVSLQKDQSAGGLIQVGEWVDVFLTSTVSNGEQETTKTAVVASNLRVIAKRNALWSIFAALPENKPVHFTLEANPYRAALIEFAKTKGALSIVPVSSSEQRGLEDKRNKLLKSKEARVLPVSFAQASTTESGGEEGRVESFVKGEYSVGTADLVRIFDLSTPPPPRSDVVVEHFSGLSRSHMTRYDADGQFIRSDDLRKARPTATAKSLGKANASGFQFFAPDSTNKACKSCNKGQK
jgi:Flp pilus assembly protein CpaB